MSLCPGLQCQLLGKVVTWVNYANRGGAPASAVTISDTLPPEVTYLAADPLPDLINGQTLTWNVASLAGGQYGAQIHISTDINAPGVVTNQAGVSSPDADVNPANNHDSATTTVTSILPPLILRPTGGVTDGTPKVSGQAPSYATVRIYNIAPATPVLLATTVANASGAFQKALSLSEGGYILAATAEKSGLVSGFSNSVAINVDLHLPLDPDQVSIIADKVDLSLGCIQAERRILPYEQLEISAVINCAAMPDAHIKIIENGLYTYTNAPVSVQDLGGGAWKLDFRTYLGAAHNTYQVFLEWDCQGAKYSALLLYILVDPDGYLYDQSMVDGGTPVSDALVTNGVITAYVKVNDQWQVWPANLYNQFNPQTTDATTPDGVQTPGYYSFLTPSGQYRLEASAPGYLPYQSPVLTVITESVHLDIGLLPLTSGTETTLAPADLSSSGLQADQEPVYAGNLLTYDLYLVNSGQIATDPLSLSDPIPTGAQYQAGSLIVLGGGTGAYESAQNRVTWQGSIPAGGTVQLRFAVLVNMPAGLTGSLTNIAALSGSDADLHSAPELKVVTTVMKRVIFLPLIRR